MPSQALTLSVCFGVGKSTAIKVVKSDVELHKLGVLSDDIGDIIEKRQYSWLPATGSKAW